MRVTIHPAARRELREARDYYEDKVKGLGKDFLARFSESLALLSAHPEAGSGIAPEVRRHLIVRFPYSVIYTLLTRDHLSVLAVAHQSRRPLYWIGRLV
jgi:toxin ParE1/3/4